MVKKPLETTITHSPRTSSPIPQPVLDTDNAPGTKTALFTAILAFVVMTPLALVAVIFLMGLITGSFDMTLLVILIALAVGLYIARSSYRAQLKVTAQKSASNHETTRPLTPP